MSDFNRKQPFYIKADPLERLAQVQLEEALSPKESRTSTGIIIAVVIVLILIIIAIIVAVIAAKKKSEKKKQ